MDEVRRHDKTVRDYVSCKIRNGEKPTDNDVTMLTLGRIALIDANDNKSEKWNVVTLGLTGTNALSPPVYNLYEKSFESLLTNMKEKLRQLETEVNVTESESDTFTRVFKDWKVGKTCDLSDQTKLNEKSAIKTSETKQKQAKTKAEANKGKAKQEAQVISSDDETDENAKKPVKAKVNTSPQAKVSTSPQMKPRPTTKKASLILVENQAKDRQEEDQKKPKQKQTKRKSVKKSDDKEKKPNISKKEQEEGAKRTKRIDEIKEIEGQPFYENVAPELAISRPLFSLDESKGEVEKESVTVTSLLMKIESDNQFITDIATNLKKLMRWKIKRYTVLLTKLFGNRQRVEEFKNTQAIKKGKKKTNEQLYNTEFQGEAYLLAQRQCDEKLRDTNVESVKTNLFEALADKTNGVISLEGKSRENIRDQLLKTIVSLSRNITQFQEGNNIILMGGSGSGKTKTASVIGYVYSKIGILANNTFRDVQPSSMMSSLVNGTTILTARKILENLEGSMLIDEAYSFIPSCTNANIKNGGADNHGSEALNQIVYQIDELKGLIVVILAGYEGSMRCLMRSNEGIDRRFSTQTTLMKYKNWDLTQMLANKINRSIETDLDRDVKKQLLTKEERTFIFEAISFLSAKQNEVFAKQAGAIDLLSRQFSILLSNDLLWKNKDEHKSILTKMFNRFLQSSGIAFKLSLKGAAAPVSGASSSAPTPVVGSPKGGYQNQGTWAKFPKIRF